MTETISELLGAARDRALPVVTGVPDDQLAAPTPCAEYDVRDLLNHLFHVVVGFRAIAGRQEADFSRRRRRTAPRARRGPCRAGTPPHRRSDVHAIPEPPDRRPRHRLIRDPPPCARRERRAWNVRHRILCN
ncbi:maleylpyruvate isomerase N-terminal domain-containing protein [Streptomyces sp. NPDC088354]|uniref:maleylpyruvate isomerase N-terminal domain-containing protein n=1 Tax=Streptomyces sp. NPDC088354 TaxID=3365856 RepID=UPI00380533C1